MTVPRLPAGCDIIERVGRANTLRARYRTPDGRRVTKTWPDVAAPGSGHQEKHARTLAREWMGDQQASLRAGTHISTADGRVTFGEYAAERMTAWRRHKPSTRAQVESHVRLHLLPTFGAVSIGNIRPAHIEAWVVDREKHLAPPTLHVVFAWLRRVLADAVRERRILSNPCEGIELPEVLRREVEPIPLAAVDALVDAMPDRFAATVLVAAWSGLRQGEVLGLRKHRLSLLGSLDERGRRQPASLYVAEQLQTLDGPPRLVPPKTKRSIRRVPIPAVLVGGLAAHLAAFPADDDGMIFTTSNGTGVRRSQFGAAWARAVDTAGLPKGTRFHDLRHTYASLLIEAGESVTVVSKRLGHASAVETLNTYSHLWPDSEGRTVEVLDAAYDRHTAERVTDGSQDSTSDA